MKLTNNQFNDIHKPISGFNQNIKRKCNNKKKPTKKRHKNPTFPTNGAEKMNHE